MAKSSDTNDTCGFCERTAEEIGTSDVLVRGKRGAICGRCLKDAYHVMHEHEARRKMKQSLLDQNAALTRENHILKGRLDTVTTMLKMWAEPVPEGQPADKE